MCAHGQRLQIAVVVPVVFFLLFTQQGRKLNQSVIIHSNNNNKILNIIVVCLWHHQESGLHGTLQTFPWATPLQYSALELLVSRSVIRYINKYCYKIYTTTLPHKLFCIVLLGCWGCQDTWGISDHRRWHKPWKVHQRCVLTTSLSFLPLLHCCPFPRPCQATEQKCHFIIT